MSYLRGQIPLRFFLPAFVQRALLLALGQGALCTGQALCLALQLPARHLADRQRLVQLLHPQGAESLAGEGKEAQDAARLHREAATRAARAGSAEGQPVAGRTAP